MKITLGLLTEGFPEIKLNATSSNCSLLPGANDQQLVFFSVFSRVAIEEHSSSNRGTSMTSSGYLKDYLV